METVGDFLCGILMTMFWIFRIVVTALSYLEIEFAIQSINVNVEIVLLFLTLICIICVFKRKVIGGLAYCIMNIAYFGPDLFTRMQIGIIPETAGLVMVDFVAIILAAMILLNIILSKTMHQTKKLNTDWFYGDKQYDRKLDERADKNNYRIY